MGSTGFVKNGQYIKADEVPLESLVATQQTMYKQHDFARQRFDHSAEILQPYDHKGKPNQKFIEAFPQAAIEYGFLPGEVKDPNSGRIPDYYPEAQNGS
jgi:hypothetical protein